MKFGINLSGGDTVFSKKLSFTVISLGFSKKIIYRNKAKINDDIYVTGNLGDSYIGLQILKKKLYMDKKHSEFFISKYYQPELQIKLCDNLIRFANSSIDISDGLIDDLKKLINRQNLSFKLYEKKLPVSSNLKKLINNKNLNKLNVVSNGDDYQILFTANVNKERIIKNISKNIGVKITKIGKIISGKNRSVIIDTKDKQIKAEKKGYIHQF